MTGLLWCLTVWGAEPVATKLPDETAVTASLTVKVSDQTGSTKAVIDATEKLGGYFSNLSDQDVVLRVPVAHVAEVIAAAGALGVVVDNEYSSQSYAEQLAQERTQLESRRKMLEQYFDVLKEADSDAVVAVETEIAQLIAEIENLEGAVRFQEHEVSFASLDIRWQFRERRAPGREGRSSFDWINTLNLADVIDEFQNDRAAPMRKAPLIGGSVPDGMSDYRFKKEIRAISPDEVLFRIRAVRHRPHADLVFWKEAVRSRMSEVGYTVLSEGDLSIGDAPAYELDLASPYGEQDYRYVLVLVPLDRQIAIIELAGEVTRFQARSTAIRSCLEAIR